ncbi:fimbrial protein [Serratia proteamaculans]|uniref:Fimbrial protein n=1 Tax=Serratia proteamaculans TaxID=28151 RepID=A0A5Q2V7W1_SERPR|nr:fimbrial protein [Serratia proteamaculans]QGH61587.1 fimbrial protein [Serratia proteamaculans]
MKFMASVFCFNQRLKQINLIFFIFFISSWSYEALAFHCFSNGVLVSGGEYRLNIKIGPNFNDGKNSFLDLSSQVQCWNDGGFIDTLSLNTGKVELNKEIFGSVSGGVSVRGANYNIPVPNVYIMTLSPVVDEHAWNAKPLPLKMYFNLNKGIGDSLNIKVGDYIGSLGFTMRNNVGSSYTYTWKIYASNNSSLEPSSCTVTAGNPLNVEFGNVERLDIGTAAGTHDVLKSLAIKCQGTDAHSINVKLSMTPTSWSTSQIATSNTDLGVSVSTGDKTLSNNDSFDMAIKGSSTADLTFSLLRNPKTKAAAVATGAFTASATLIVSEP